MNKENHYNGAEIRSKGELSSKLDTRIPNFYSQYSYKQSGRPRIFLVCRKKVHGELCVFDVRKDQYLKDPELYDSHECRSSEIEKYFRPQNQSTLRPINE